MTIAIPNTDGGIDPSKSEEDECEKSLRTYEDASADLDQRLELEETKIIISKLAVPERDKMDMMAMVGQNIQALSTRRI
eukprot:10040937-Karenia_brevis.AAC.1